MSSLLDSALSAGSVVAGFCAFGALLIAHRAWRSLLATYKMYLRPGKNLKKLGEWCVVTGATDGIGKEYAFAFAKRGLNVVLISRTESKLQDVAKEIKERYSGVHIKYIVCDYSNFDKKARDAVYKAIQGLDIGVLVNNVGISYRYPVYFHELDDEAVHHLVEMNINSTVYMTRMVLPGMLERKRGAIINISSGSSQITLPLLAEYGAAKSFIEKFSRALNAEYSSKGVTCQCQIPFYVATKLAKMRKSLIVPTPKEYVASAIRYVGYPDAVVAPILLHAIQGWLFDVLPDFVVSHLVMSRHMGIRKRGQKKDAKLATEGGKKAE